jgi:hypothetical protein
VNPAHPRRLFADVMNGGSLRGLLRLGRGRRGGGRFRDGLGLRLHFGFLVTDIAGHDVS